jgi:hypothetical protein
MFLPNVGRLSTDYTFQNTELFMTTAVRTSNSNSRTESFNFLQKMADVLQDRSSRYNFWLPGATASAIQRDGSYWEQCLNYMEGARVFPTSYAQEI